MAEEIKSAVAIAQSHVSIIVAANTDFSDIGAAPASSLQINWPTDAMRTTFESANAVCTDLCSYLGEDVKKILLMADEFETWDQQAGNQDG